MGYPAFYKDVAKHGLSFTSLLFDYGDFLYPNEEGVNDCCLGAPDMLGSLFDNRDDDQKTKDLKIAGGIIKAMRERLSDIPAKSQEALTIQAGWRFLWWVRDFAQPCHSGSDPIDDPQALESAISNFTELRQTLSRIEPEGRRDLEQHIDWAIRACQDQLGTTGMNRSEPSSPSPTQLEAQNTPSGAGSELSGLPKELTLDLGRSSGLSAIIGSRVKLELVLIPAGKFVMGSPLHEEGRTDLECPPLDVTISQPYYMGKYQVTQEQYEKIMGRNFSDMKGARNPADRVSWNDASEFCRKLSALTGKTVRLPTMAEWEYACRAGTTTRFHSGDSDSDLNCVGWYENNSSQRTHPVGQKAPNAWGLYDMHGNVYEWCQDVGGGYDYFGSGPVTDPKGPTELDAYALRGGCWGSSANDCRSAGGMECTTDPRNNMTGFRVVVDHRLKKIVNAEPVSRAGDVAPDKRATALQDIQKDEVPSGGGESHSEASQASMSDFSFRRDFKRIQWVETLWLNCLRAAAAGIVWCIVFSILQPQDIRHWLILPIALPLGYPVILLPIGLLAAFLSQRGLPWLGIVTLLFTLEVFPGDPLVFILHKVYPRLVPVQRFGFVNFRLVLFVLCDVA